MINIMTVAGILKTHGFGFDRSFYVDKTLTGMALHISERSGCSGVFLKLCKMVDGNEVKTLAMPFYVTTELEVQFAISSCRVLFNACQIEDVD